MVEYGYEKDIGGLVSRMKGMLNEVGKGITKAVKHLENEELLEARDSIEVVAGGLDMVCDDIDEIMRERRGERGY